MEINTLQKEMFIEIISALDIPYNEGIQNDFVKTNPRLVFWDYAWEPVSASGHIYQMICTYQVSFFNDCVPRESSELITLLKKLSEKNINPVVSHEYVEKDKTWHSYFAIDLLEDV